MCSGTVTSTIRKLLLVLWGQCHYFLFNDPMQRFSEWPAEKSGIRVKRTHDFGGDDFCGRLFRKNLGTSTPSLYRLRGLMAFPDNIELQKTSEQSNCADTKSDTVWIFDFSLPVMTFNVMNSGMKRLKGALRFSIVSSSTHSASDSFANVPSDMVRKVLHRRAVNCPHLPSWRVTPYQLPIVLSRRIKTRSRPNLESRSSKWTLCLVAPTIVRILRSTSWSVLTLNRFLPNKSKTGIPSV